MPTNKQRRDSARRHLERQLQRREERDARRKKVNLIASVAGTLVLIAVIVVVIVINTGDDSTTQAGGNPGNQSRPTGATTPSTTTSTSPTTSASSLPPVGTPAACASAPKGSTVTFDGVTIKNTNDLTKAPTVTAKVSKPATALECMDLVVGKGQAADPKSTVSVQYLGALLSNGKVFDSSWSRGAKPISFPLTGVVPGFTQGIGGTGKVTPMKIGGRRIVILPAALGYGASGTQGIPGGASLIFVIDLTKVTN